MAEEGFKRKLTAILSADVEGYSRLMGDDEESTVRTLTAYRSAINDIVQQFRGRIVDTPGDNILADFTSVVDAVNCAVEIQRDLAIRNTGMRDNRQMQFRIGVNLGDVIEEKNCIYGDGVNIAARIEGLAEPGGICISGSTHEQIENKLALNFEYLGEHTAKNIAKPIRVYRVSKNDETRISIGKNTGQNPALELPDLPSIAVLPFDNMGSDPKHHFLADMISDNIITSLSKLPNLFVIARNSTFSYKGKQFKIQQVASELRVKYVLEGSVIKSDNRVRIIAQLIDAATGHHIWAERYDRNMKDLLALQDDITFKIITALQVKLTDGEKARVWGRETPNLQAYENIMQSYKHLLTWTKEGLAVTREMAEVAHSLDPQYTCAYRMLGVCELFDGVFGWSESPAQSLEQAEKYLRKCLDLDTLDGRTRCILGLIYTCKRQHEKAIAEGYRAIELAPNDADTYVFLAYNLHFVGKRSEAIQLIERSMRLNPIVLNYCFAWLGEIFLFREQFFDAIKALNKAIRDAPNFISPYICLAAAYSLSDQKEDANAAVKKVLRIDPRFSVENFAITLPFKNQADIEFLIAALKKAGMK